MSATSPRVEREGRLNHAQEDWFAGQPQQPDTACDNNSVSAVSVADATVGEAMDAVGVLLTRHEALRSLTDPTAGPHGRQQVCSAPRTAADLHAVVRTVEAHDAPNAFGELRGTCFDLAHEWPIRFLVAHHDGKVQDIGVVADHAALDVSGMNVLREDLHSLLSAPSSALPGVPEQPLDVVDWEELPAAARYRERSEEFWRGQARQLTDLLERYGVDTTVDSSLHGHGSTYRTVWLSTPNLLDSASKASASLRAPIPAVLLTAFGLALCRSSGQRVSSPLALTANRRTKEARLSADKRFMQGPVVVHADEDIALSKLVGSTAFQLMCASTLSHIAKDRANTLWGEALPRGIAPELAGAFFNYVDETVMEAVPLSGRLPGSGLVGDWVPLDAFAQDTRLRRGPDLMLLVVEGRDRMRLGLKYREDHPAADLGEGFLRSLAGLVRFMGESPDRAEARLGDALAVRP
ncbi:condensation domain-containing protein [Streptomyces sp. NPDC051677]|uniref:condensation domain-containing protein n=1 Tax=Streptomyces sp. NPDC051677 TaxID=3365669 RepID=UPI0037D899CC